LNVKDGGVRDGLSAVRLEERDNRANISVVGPAEKTAPRSSFGTPLNVEGKNQWRGTGKPGAKKCLTTLFCRLTKRPWGGNGTVRGKGQTKPKREKLGGPKSQKGALVRESGKKKSRRPMEKGKEKGGGGVINGTLRETRASVNIEPPKKGSEKMRKKAYPSSGYPPRDRRDRGGVNGNRERNQQFRRPRANFT